MSESAYEFKTMAREWITKRLEDEGIQCTWMASPNNSDYIIYPNLGVRGVVKIRIEQRTREIEINKVRVEIVWKVERTNGIHYSETLFLENICQDVFDRLEKVSKI